MEIRMETQKTEQKPEQLSFAGLMAAIKRTELPVDKYLTSAFAAHSVGSFFAVGRTLTAFMFEKLHAMANLGDSLDNTKKQLFYRSLDSVPVPNASLISLPYMRGVHGLVGVASEFGELYKALQAKDRIGVGEEIGDMLYYLGLIADSNNLTLDECALMMIRKLEKRHGEAFSLTGSETRDVEAERAVMEEITK